MKKVIFILLAFTLFSFYQGSLKNFEGKWKLSKMVNESSKKEVKSIDNLKIRMGDTIIINDDSISFTSNVGKTQNQSNRYVLGNDNRLSIKRENGNVDPNFGFKSEVYLIKTDKNMIILELKGVKAEKDRWLKLYFRKIK